MEKYQPGALVDLLGPSCDTGEDPQTKEKSVFDKKVQLKQKKVTNAPTTSFLGEVAKRNSQKKRLLTAPIANFEEQERRTVYVGNLAVDTSEKDLKRLFKNFGHIEAIRFRCAIPSNPKLPKKAAVIKREFHEDCESLSAYVRFLTVEEAEAAVTLNCSLFKDRHLRVDIAGNETKYDAKKTVFLGNLPFNIKSEDVFSHFADCGNIEAVRIVRSDTGLSKGFGFIMFKESTSCPLALKLNGSQLSGRDIRVTPVLKKPKRKNIMEHRQLQTATRKRQHERQSKFSRPDAALSTNYRNTSAAKVNRNKPLKKKKNKKAKKFSSLFSTV